MPILQPSDPYAPAGTHTPDRTAGGEAPGIGFYTAVFATEDREFLLLAF